MQSSEPEKVPPPQTSSLAPRNPDGTLKAGNSLNPGGRPAGIGAIRKAAKEYSPTILDMLYQLAMDSKAKHRDRIVAGSIILDRAYGKPAQEIRISDKDSHQPDLSQLSQSDLDKIAEIQIKIALPIAKDNIIDIEPTNQT